LALFKAYRAFRLALATIRTNLRQAALGLSASDSLQVRIVYLLPFLIAGQGIPGLEAIIKINAKLIDH
jgi:hypothetical protein